MINCVESTQMMFDCKSIERERMDEVWNDFKVNVRLKFQCEPPLSSFFQIHNSNKVSFEGLSVAIVTSVSVLADGRSTDMTLIVKKL
jgi:hypothetical protein